MSDYDVVVVGGSPLGAAAARHAAFAGARVLLIEKGDGTGEPVQCAGIISPHALETLGASNASVLREIRGGRLYSPGGKTIELRADTTKAVVIDRGALTRELISAAAVAGVVVRTNTRAIAARKGLITIEDERARREDLSVGVIIGADGPKSAIASWFSLPGPDRFLVAAQVVIAAEARVDDEVEIFFGKNIAPGFFAWAIPAEEGLLRVGLAATPKSDANMLLTRLLQERFPGKVLTRIGGVIPIGPAQTTVADGALLLGDAAGQVKPTSGGGLYTGGICARIAGQVAGIATGCAAPVGEVDLKTLSVYEQRWQEEIGDELRFGLAARLLLSALTDAEIDRLFEAINLPETLHVIVENGDIDYSSRLIRPLLAQKEIRARLFSALGGWDRIQDLVRLAFASEGESPV